MSSCDHQTAPVLLNPVLGTRFSSVSAPCSVHYLHTHTTTDRFTRALVRLLTSTAARDAGGVKTARRGSVCLCILSPATKTSPLYPSHLNGINISGRRPLGREPPRGLDSLWIKMFFWAEVDVEFSSHSPSLPPCESCLCCLCFSPPCWTAQWL